MRILSLYYTHKPGGFCKRLYRLFAALVARGHDVHYFTLDTPPPEFPRGVCIHRIPFFTSSRKGFLFWLTFSAWCQLWLLFAAIRLRPERYAVFGAYYAAMLALARTVYRAPLVLFLRSLVFEINVYNQEPLAFRFFSNFLDRTGMRRADLVICMTDTMKTRAEKFADKKFKDSIILPNDLPSPVALASSGHQPRQHPPITLLTFGVLDHRKNVGYLLRTLAAMQKKPRPFFHLIVAGDGPLLHEHKAFVEAQGTPGIEFAGWQSSLAPFLQRADLIVHPSLHEGMPNAVLEALAAGKPVLASDIPEHREMLEVDALLFRFDGSGDLKQRLAALEEKPETLNELITLSAACAKKFSFDWDEKASKLILTAK